MMTGEECGKFILKSIPKFLRVRPAKIFESVQYIGKIKEFLTSPSKVTNLLHCFSAVIVCLI